MIDTSLPEHWTQEMANAFQEFLELRKKMKKPILTQRGYKSLVSSVDRLSGMNNDKGLRIINRTLDNEWRGFFSLEESVNEYL